MGQIFYVAPSIGFVALFGGLALVLASLGLLLVMWGWRTKRLRYTIIASAIFFIISSVLGFVVASSYMVRISIEEDYITIEAPPAFISTSIAWDEIEKTYIIDWKVENDYQPVMRELGIEFLDYRVGRFTLSNGVSAIILATDSRNLVIQTRDGRLFMISLEEFDELAASFRGKFITSQKEA